MKIRFHDSLEHSPLFGETYRPSAEVWLQARETGKWHSIIMVVDTGADVTLLPRWLARVLNVDLKIDCRPIEMSGIGGNETVWLARHMRARLGPWQRWIPLGFLERDDILPLLGRKDFSETFRMVFERHSVIFSEPRLAKRESH